MYTEVDKEIAESQKLFLSELVIILFGRWQMNSVKILKSRGAIHTGTALPLFSCKVRGATENVHASLLIRDFKLILFKQSLKFLCPAEASHLSVVVPDSSSRGRRILPRQLMLC